MGAFATSLFVLVATITATVQADQFPTKCNPEDVNCLAFVGDVERALPRKGGEVASVFIGSWVYTLPAWEAPSGDALRWLPGRKPVARVSGRWPRSCGWWRTAQRWPAAPQHHVAWRWPAANLNHSRHPVLALGVPPEAPLSASAVKARRIAAEVRAQARVIESGGMPSWPKPRQAADRRMLYAARVLAWYLDGETLPDPTSGAVMFYSPDVQTVLGRQRPSWIEEFAQTTMVGDHLFYRLAPSPSEQSEQVAETPP